MCLACCQELRDGKQPGGKWAGSAKYHVQESAKDTVSLVQSSKHELPIWKVNADGSIPCPPKERGGCGFLQISLRQTGKPHWIPKLVKSVEAAVGNEKIIKPNPSEPCQLCFNENNPKSAVNCGCLREAAQREATPDNFIYCPTVEIIKKEGLKHFQRHWIKGEPVIVRNVVDKVASVSWEPMVMWRALRESDKNKFDDEETNSLKAVDCLDWCQVHSLWMMYLYTGSHLNLNKRETSCTSPILKMRILLHYYLAGGYKYSSIF